jgi:serine-type D-Ala-D-Ala carboxypeptidase/endopeptidase (penicillin-binding protein 4)
MRLLILVCLLCPAVWYSCSPVSKTALRKKFVETEDEFHDHTGFMLYDPSSRKILFKHHADRYFTPASNTKIFTLYTSLTVLGDSIPGLRYVIRGDSMLFTGTGDPSFLYRNVFNNDRIYNFLREAPYQLYYTEANFQTTHFGPGWSWEDYDYVFSSSRSSFPIYGNTFEVVRQHNSLRSVPSYFMPFLFSAHDTLDDARLIRSPFSNATTYYPGKKITIAKWTKPFITDSLMTVALLSDTLHREITFLHQHLPPPVRTVYSLPADSLYKVMMQESDNFIAEQLLLTCAGVLSDTLKPEIAINYMKNNFLADLPDEPVWIDGSGLSRYNLFTPRSIVKLWDKLLTLVPRERLFKLLAVGGVSGTLSNTYKDQNPYIFGKTGTLSNVHCLSGYIVSRKGRTLIFSFMNTNYTTSTHTIRARMEEIMKLIHDHY